MVWYDLFKSCAISEVADVANDVLNESFIVLISSIEKTLHAKGKTKANLVQVELLAEVKGVLLGVNGH